MLKGKIVLLTGATDGIGKQTALRMAQKGAVLLLHGKDNEKGEQVLGEIRNQTGNSEIHYFNADFTSFTEINQLANAIRKHFPRVDILVNNAGIFDHNRTILPNGIEKNFMVNHLSGVALTLSILDLLEKSAQARVINVSSMIHAHNIDFENLNGEKYYSGEEAYSLSKLCNIIFTYELSNRLESPHITVNSMHPGVINTKLLRRGWGSMGAHTDEGAIQILYLASSDDVAKITGKYFINNKPVRSAHISYNKNIRRKLWDLSFDMINNNNL